MDDYFTLDWAITVWLFTWFIILVLLFKWFKPIVVYQLCASLYTFVRVTKRGRLFVWGREFSTDTRRAPLLSRRPCGSGLYQNELPNVNTATVASTVATVATPLSDAAADTAVVAIASGSGAGDAQAVSRDSVALAAAKRVAAEHEAQLFESEGGNRSIEQFYDADEQPDGWETFPCCCCCCSCFPSVQSNLKYFLWSAIFLMNILFFSSCVLESRFWYSSGCPPDDSGASSGLYTSGSPLPTGDEWKCFPIFATFRAYPAPQYTNCSDPFSSSAAKSCFRWVPQSPETWLNTVAVAATILNFVVGACVSVLGNQLHASSNQDLYERVLVAAGNIGFFIVAPTILSLGFLTSPVAYVVLEAVPANCIMIGKMHRTWRRQRAIDERRGAARGIRSRDHSINSRDQPKPLAT